jgi:hypothetical protein
MAVIKPPITGDLALDSWLNQITQAINKGDIGTVGATGRATTGASGFNTATIYLFARTSTNSAPAKPNEQTVYTYSTAAIVGSSSNNNGVSGGIGVSPIANTWFRSVPPASDGEYAWITSVNVADLDPIETISASSWTAVSALAAPGLSNRVDIAYFTVLDGSSGTNSFPTGTVAGGNYTKATKGSRNFEGIRTVSWEGIEPAPSTTISDYVITQMQGDEGTKVSVVELFKVSTSNSSAPADPTGTFTYTFATNILSGGTPNGWLQNASTVPAGQYLWKIQASATSTASSVQIASSAFSDAVVVSGTGAVGGTGQRQTTGIIYYTAQSANAPTRPTNGTSGGTSNATWNWSAGNFSTLPSNWSMSPPTPNPTDTNSYWQSAFSSYETTNGGTTNLTFEAPTKIIVFDGIVKFTNSNNSIASTSGGSTTTVFFPKVFRQSGIPTSLAKNDVWIDTDDNQMYIAQIAGADAVTTGEWERSVDATAQSAANTATTNAATAQTAANNAQAAADNKSKTFKQDTMPSATAAGDIWIDTNDSNKMYFATNANAGPSSAGGTPSNWILEDFASIINANTTTIDGGKITANSVTATQVAANTITANQIATNAITADEINAGAITAVKLDADAITGKNILIGDLAVNTSTGAVTGGEGFKAIGTGTGAGVVAMGDATTNITVHPSSGLLTLNGNIVATGNLNANSVTTSATLFPSSLVITSNTYQDLGTITLSVSDGMTGAFWFSGFINFPSEAGQGSLYPGPMALRLLYSDGSSAYTFTENVNSGGGTARRIDGLALFTAVSGATSMPIKLQGAIASSDTNIRDTTLSGFQVLGIGLKR